MRENHYRVLKIRENRVPRIREIGSLQVHAGYLTFSLKKTAYITAKTGQSLAVHHNGKYCTKNN